jgi:hypothetical protein
MATKLMPTLRRDISFLSSRLFAVYALLACSIGFSSQGVLRQASGIALDGPDLIIVGNGTPSTVFRYRLNPSDMPTGNGPRLAVIEIDQADVETGFGGRRALDLEAIDVLPDGQVVVLSEATISLLNSDGPVARYPFAFAQFGARGLEGLAVHANGRIAALWEGGYTSRAYLPTRYDDADRLFDKPIKPIICVHDALDLPSAVVCEDDHDVTVLRVPDTPDSSQSFRAPDLVWSVDGESFIVLLSSTNSASDRFRYKWLQKFTISGEAAEPPVNLCDSGYLPENVRSGRGGNVEGLGWFEPGKSLMLVNDYSEAATVVIISVDPWPSTDNTIACDESVAANLSVE